MARQLNPDDALASLMSGVPSSYKSPVTEIRDKNDEALDALVGKPVSTQEEFDKNEEADAEAWADILTAKPSLTKELTGTAMVSKLNAPIQEGLKQIGEDKLSAKKLVKAFQTGEGPSSEEVLSSLIGEEKYGEFLQKAHEEKISRKQALKKYYSAVMGDKVGSLAANASALFDAGNVADLAESIVTDPTTYVGLGLGRKAFSKSTAKIVSELEEGAAKTIGELALEKAGLESELATTEPLRFVSQTATGIKRLPTAAEELPVKNAQAFVMPDSATSLRSEQPMAASALEEQMLGRRIESTVPAASENVAEIGPSGRALLAKRQPQLYVMQRPGGGNIHVETPAYPEALVTEEQMWGKPKTVAGTTNKKRILTLDKDGNLVPIEQPVNVIELGGQRQPVALLQAPKGEVKTIGATAEKILDREKIIAKNKELGDTIRSLYATAKNVGLDPDMVQNIKANELASIVSDFKDFESKSGNGKFRSILDWSFNPENVIAEELPAEKAAPLISQADKSFRSFTQMRTFATKKEQDAINILKEAYGEGEKFKKAENIVQDAWTDRTKVEKLIKPNSPEEKAFKSLSAISDELFEPIRRAKGLDIVEGEKGYGPIFRDLSNFKNQETAETWLSNWKQDVPERVKSVYNIARKESSLPIKRGLLSDGLVRRWINSQTRMLAFDDLAKLYKEGGYGALGKPGLQKTVDAWMNDIITPQIFSDTEKKIGTLTSRLFKKQVKWNPFSSLINTPQADLAKMKVSPEARKMGDEIVDKWTGSIKKGLPESVNKFFSDIHSDFSSWLSGFTPEGEITRETLRDKGLFGMTEATNWARSRAWGRLEQLKQEPLFQEQLQKSGSWTKALDKLIKNKSPEVDRMLERSIIRGEQLAGDAQIQFGSIGQPHIITGMKRNLSWPGMLMAQYKRFPLGAAEFMWNAFRDKGKLIAITRRGFAPDVKVVDGLRSLTYLEKAVAKAAKGKNKAEYSAILEGIKDDKADLMAKINELEPTNKAKALKYTMSYLGKGAAFTYAKYRILSSLFKAFGEERQEPTALEFITSSVPAIEIVKDPNSLFSIPLLPSQSRGSGWKGYAKGAIRKGVQLSPIGAIDTATGGLVGRKIANAIVRGK